MLKVTRPTKAFILKNGVADYCVYLDGELIGSITRQEWARATCGKWIAVSPDGNWENFQTKTESIAWIYHKAMTREESKGKL